MMLQSDYASRINAERSTRNHVIPPPPPNNKRSSLDLRFSPLLLLAAVAIVSLAVFFVHETRPAVADHGTEETYWTATLTVKSWSAAGVARGCSNGESGKECSATSVLSDDDFTYGGASYTVSLLRYIASDNKFSLAFDKPLPADLKSAASLYADGTAHPLVSATATALNDGGELLEIPTSSVSWSAGDSVTLALKRPAAPPSGVELAGTDLDTSGGAGHFDVAVTEGASATFTLALSADPGTDATVNLVKTQYNQSGVGADNHRWNVGGATVAPETLTFTAGTSGNWNTAQTVTVTSPQDDDSCSEQLIILVLAPTQRYGYAYVGEDNGNYNLNSAGDYVWAGTGEGEYSYQLIDDYDPAGGSGSSVTGVYVTVADDDGGSCGGV